jgi:hypothetical protein
VFRAGWRILASIVLAQTLLAKRNQLARNANVLRMSIRLARLAMSRLTDSLRCKFVRLSDLVCVVRLIA